MYDRIGELIARRRKELGMNQAQLAASMNKMGFSLSNQAVSKWENGSTLPNARQFLALCDALGVDDIRGVFSGRGEGLLSGLDREGRKLVMDYAQLLRDSGRYSQEPPLRSLPLYSLAVSAGTGQFLDGEDYEMVEVGREVPDGANFGVRVAGDSMEPQFHDGQVIWVRQQRSLMTGEIGIFLYDGNAYLKQLVAHEEALAAIAECLERTAEVPPELAEIAQECKLTMPLARRAMASLCEQGRACRVTGDLFYDAQVMDRMKAAVADLCSREEGAGMGELREAMGISRKRAVPVLEMLDMEGFTVRVDDRRFLK